MVAGDDTRTALMVAAKLDNVWVLEQLLQPRRGGGPGASVCARDLNEWTALHLSCRSGAATAGG